MEDILPKKYDSKISEEKWQKYWEENDVYKHEFDSDKEEYVVDTPPPTVSGKMHLGHAFSFSQQDFCVRYQRMLGKNVFFPFGTDDNGLPTEKLVEKTKKVRATRMDRNEFIALCNETVKELKPAFIKDWKDIGMSCDFKNFTYSTIDPHCIKTAQMSFLDLFKKKLVYRQESPVMWCTQSQTAIAQADLEDKEVASTFNDIEFKVKETEEKIIIATTRPELLPACVCIFVHPTDDRYKHLVGKHAIVPLFEQEVPIIADESANPEKGSGILMICSYGDRFDVDSIRRHKLKPRMIIEKNGTLNETAKEFAGLRVKDARKEILSKLEVLSFLKESKPIKHMVNVYERSGQEIEFLSTKQWFVKVVDYKDAIKRQSEKINWRPEHMKKRFDDWVENLNWDWCVSRQRPFGVSIPVWYSKKTGESILAKPEQLPCDPLVDKPLELPEGHTYDDIEPETDVFDTWFTSSVTPQIISNWVADEDKAEYNFNNLFPTHLRPQAHDIIRTWAFYTIVKSMHHEQTIPWRDIVISGHVLDPRGNKMSKSKGNVIVPSDVVEKYGADAMRFWSSTSKLGEDLPYMEKDLKTGQKVVNKLWNATKFTLSHLSDFDPSNHDVKLVDFDKIILKKFYAMCDENKEYIDTYEYSKIRNNVERFFFDDLCDHYLEVVKDFLYKPDIYGDERRQSAQYTLYHLIYGCIKWFAPIMPHITEELYQAYFRKYDEAVSIHRTLLPSYDFEELEVEEPNLVDVVFRVLDDVRKYKSEKAMSLNAELDKLTIISKIPIEQLEKVKSEFKAPTKSLEVEFEVLPAMDEVTDLIVRI